MNKTVALDYPKAAIAIIRRGDRYLTVSRRHDSNDMGLPGGKVDPGESVEDGLRREVEEEVGLQIGKLHLVSSHLYRKHFVYSYWVEDWEGEPSSREGTRVDWLTVEELAEQATFGAFNRELIDRLNSN